MRPKLAVDKFLDKEMTYEEMPGIESCGDTCCFPHCDMRILHAPDECSSCAKFEWLQDERTRLDVSNSGKMNRRWQCPADEARGAPVMRGTTTVDHGYHMWGGNIPKKESE